MLVRSYHHDSFAGFVADKHIAHSGVAISAGGILSGGGTIVANRTISLAHGDVDHDQLTNTHDLTNDIDHNAIANTHNLGADIDHGNLSGLDTGADHSFIDQDVKVAATPTFAELILALGASQNYQFLPTAVATELGLQGQSLNTLNRLSMFAGTGDGGEHVGFRIVGKGTPSYPVGHHSMFIQWNRDTGSYVVSTATSGMALLLSGGGTGATAAHFELCGTTRRGRMRGQLLLDQPTVEEPFFDFMGTEASTTRATIVDELGDDGEPPAGPWHSCDGIDWTVVKMVKVNVNDSGSNLYLAVYESCDNS